jgi:hypothetical protein
MAGTARAVDTDQVVARAADMARVVGTLYRTVPRVVLPVAM